MRKIALICAYLLIGMSQLWAQTKEVTGKITDSKDGSALAGVTVKVKGTENATVSGPDGTFKISYSGTKAVLIFTYVGFEDLEYPVRGNSMTVSMVSGTKNLNEVVVVGYGSKLKRDLTGSVARVNAKDLVNTPVTSFESALQGRAAGVQITQQNGKLGQGINVRIRGSASVSAGNEPLYVVDGIPVITTNLSSNGAQTSPLADLNINDIESVEILKDASAAAIYGSRGSNGVVLISTKKGKAGKSKIEFGYYTGTQAPTGKVDFMNAQEYVEYFRLAAAAAQRLDPSFNYVSFNEGRLQRYSAGNTDYQTFKVNTDWQEEAFQKAPISQYDINFSGGNDKTTFYMGGQFLDQTGIIVRNSLKRFNGRLNLEHKVRDWLTLGMNMSFARTTNNRISNDNAFSTPLQIVALSPITPLIDPRTGLTSGALDLATGRPNTNFPVYYNPVLSVENAQYQTLVNRTLGNLFGNVNIVKGLTFRTELGVDQLNQTEESYNGKLTARNLGVPNGAGFASTDQILNINTNNFFQYNTSFAESHDLDFVAGMSLQNYSQTFASSNAEQFPGDSYKKLNSGASITGGSSTETEFSFLSYFGRANYKFKNKYLVGVSGRYDGSSRFGSNNRYGFFPAASVGWIISEEKFMEKAKFINFLKLKSSYGLTGNAEIGNFASYGLFSGAFGYAGFGGARQTQIENPDLKWETTKSFDLGFEAAAFNSRLTLEFAYYQRNTKDLLLNVEVPGTTGFAAQLRNIGNLENQGFEITLTTENITTKNFRWSTNLNFSRNTNKVTNLSGQELGTAGQNRAREGQPLGVFVAREFAGADPATGDALYIKNTLKSDGTRDRSTTNDYNEAQDVVIGSPLPDFIYGINNTFTYKGVSLDVLLQGVQGNDIYYGGGQYMSASGSNGYDNQTRDQLNSWKKPGDITNVPEARLFFGNGVNPSSRYIDDGSFLRVKAVTLGYNLPKSVLNKLRLDKVRIYIRGQNLLTFRNNENGWDPEVNADFQANNINQGVDFYSAPQLRTLIFGINIGL
jgi:TonB-dependent starch-binding outer membrane protein SusC